MPSRSTFALIIAALTSMFTAALAGHAQEPQPPSAGAPAGKQQHEKLAYFAERIAKLQVAPAGEADKPFPFVAEPLITFENPVSQMWDGFMFAWTDGGRPAAAVKCYYHSINKRWGRTFVSLSGGRIQMTAGGKQFWTPAEAGLSFAELPGASKPAHDARRRLTQMRDIARRFTIIDHWGLKDPTDWRLRLLTTPLYRYEAPQLGVVDGALFGYVANSPEALVLVEAQKSGDGLAWHYAVARMTRFEVTVSLDAKEIAHFPRLDAWPKSGVYFHDPVDIADYPFQRDAGELEQKNPGLRLTK